MIHLYGSTVQRRHRVEDTSGIGEARRDARRLSTEIQADDIVSGRLALVVTELATNLVRHGHGGELLLQAIPTDSGHLLEVIAIDRGPGIADVQRSLRDGVSTSTTPGTGLGAVKRLSDEFDVYSVVGVGTAVVARLGSAARRAFGVICIAREGETSCGDAWCISVEGGERWAVAVLDGLGHGAAAAEAALCGVGLFRREPFDEPRTQLERAHRALASTRGAAVAYATCGASTVHYAGVGNVAGRLCGPEAVQGLVSHNGALGFQMPRVQQFDYSLWSGAILVMHTDGLSSRWDLRGYEGLRARHPAIVAAILYRDFGRGRDDATVVVVPT
jgi:anti-sigma regulatory factor (Ser/Thr protein kinase)